MSRSFSLDSRLSLCCEFVRQGKTVADIGTDHAFLPVYLVQSGKIPSAIASDINPDPLEKGRQTIKKHHLEDKILTRLSSGLEKISPDECDDIVIAGMGGETIISILDAAPWVKDPQKRLILQPMSKVHLLIDYLSSQGFEIESQRTTAASGKIYTVMAVSYTAEKICEDELYPYIGKLHPETDELDRSFVEAELRTLLKKADFCEESKILAKKLSERLGKL